MPLLAAALMTGGQLLHVHDMRRRQQDAAQAERGRALEEMAQPVLAMAEIEQHQVEPQRLELALHVLGERGVDALLDVAGHQRHRAAAPDPEAARHLVGPVAELLDRLQHARPRLGATGTRPARTRDTVAGETLGVGGDGDDAHHQRLPLSLCLSPCSRLRAGRAAPPARHCGRRCRRCSCRARCRCR